MTDCTKFMGVVLCLAAAMLAPVQHILPDHSAVGDGSLVAQDRAFIADLRSRALQLKSQGIDAAAAGVTLTDEFKQKYPDWAITSVGGFVKSVYAE